MLCDMCIVQVCNQKRRSLELQVNSLYAGLSVKLRTQNKEIQVWLDCMKGPSGLRGMARPGALGLVCCAPACCVL